MFAVKSIDHLRSITTAAAKNTLFDPLAKLSSMAKNFACDGRIFFEALCSAGHESKIKILNELLGDHFVRQFSKGLKKEAMPPESEYNLFGPRSFREAMHLINFLSENLCIQLPLPPIMQIPGIPFVRRGPKHFRVKGHGSFPDEAWYFVNGVMTEESIARMNGEYLAAIFHRDIEIINNPTDTLLGDLLECALGKFWKIPTETVWHTLERIVPQLAAPHIKSVIVIAHSQGAIIMSNVLRLLVSDYSRILSRYLESKQIPPKSDILPKLEIYTFACPTDEMCLPETNSPFLEHFSNDRDFVARLGIIAEKGKARGTIRIDGNLFRHNSTGHFLNAHYLPNFEKKMYNRQNGRGQRVSNARLYKYISGGAP